MRYVWSQLQEQYEHVFLEMLRYSIHNQIITILATPRTSSLKNRYIHLECIICRFFIQFASPLTYLLCANYYSRIQKHHSTAHEFTFQKFKEFHPIQK